MPRKNGRTGCLSRHESVLVEIENGLCAVTHKNTALGYLRNTTQDTLLPSGSDPKSALVAGRGFAALPSASISASERQL